MILFADYNTLIFRYFLCTLDRPLEIFALICGHMLGCS